MLSKYKENTNREFAPVYFKFTTTTVICLKDSLYKSLQEIFNRIDNWTSEGSSWAIGSIDGEYVSISIYSPFLGSSCIVLLDKLRNSRKGLINIKNNENKFFLWCDIRHLNPLKTHPGKIIKADEEVICSLDYVDI